MALPAKFRVLLIDAQNDFSDALMPDGGAVGMGTITFKKDVTYTITIGSGGSGIVKISVKN